MSSSATRAPSSVSRRGRERLRRAPALVERAHVLHATSRETICESMPRHGPSTAEYRPASPPAASRTMSSGLSHLVIERVRVGGVDLWRRLAAAQLARRPADGVEHRLAQPLLAPAGGAEHRLVLGADDVHGRPAERPPVRAPRRGAGPAQDVGEVLAASWRGGRRSTAARRSRRPSRRSRRATNPRSTCSGSHGLPASSSAMQKPSLPGCPSVDRSSRPGAPPPVSVTTSRSARPIVRFARQPGTEHAHAAVHADRLGGPDR